MLKDDLKTLLATTYAFVIKTQNFHWNVEGPDFSQLHLFFGSIYEDVYGSIDCTAEFIRTLDEYAPGSFERFTALSRIEGQTKIPRAKLMLQELQSDNQIIIAHLEQTFESAQNEKKEGIANFIAERLDAHGKWGWQIRSFLKADRA